MALLWTLITQEHERVDSVINAALRWFSVCAKVCIISHLLLLHIFSSSFMPWLNTCFLFFIIQGEKMFVRFAGHEHVPCSPQLQGMWLSKDADCSTVVSINRSVLKATLSMSCSSSGLSTAGLRKQPRFRKTRDSSEGWLWSRTPQFPDKQALDCMTI